MFVACGIWCLADVSSVSLSSEQKTDSRLESSLTNMSILIDGNLFFSANHSHRYTKTPSILCLRW